MDYFEVQIDGFSDNTLEFYGWYKVHVGATFSKYYNYRYDEEQPVSNAPPRFLIIDDPNDAQYMVRDGAKITRRPRKL